MGKCKDIPRGDVRSPTYRTLLRMLRAGTGVKTSNNMRIADAIKDIEMLAGGLVNSKAISRRNSGIASLQELLTNYTGKSVSFAEASMCFHNPRSRGLEHTEFFTDLLSGRRWPPFAPVTAPLGFVPTVGMITAPLECYNNIPDAYTDWHPKGVYTADEWVQYIAERSL
jgi:hypothetical protein